MNQAGCFLLMLVHLSIQEENMLKISCLFDIAERACWTSKTWNTVLGAVDLRQHFVLAHRRGLQWCARFTLRGRIELYYITSEATGSFQSSEQWAQAVRADSISIVDLCCTVTTTTSLRSTTETVQSFRWLWLMLGLKGLNEPKGKETDCHLG